jgi:hypothetical protein
MFIGACTVFVLAILNLFAFASHDDRLSRLEKDALKKIGGSYGNN